MNPTDAELRESQARVQLPRRSTHIGEGSGRASTGTALAGWLTTAGVAGGRTLKNAAVGVVRNTMVVSRNANADASGHLGAAPEEECAGGVTAEGMERHRVPNAAVESRAHGGKGGCLAAAAIDSPASSAWGEDDQCSEVQDIGGQASLVVSYNC